MQLSKITHELPLSTRLGGQSVHWELAAPTHAAQVGWQGTQEFKITLPKVLIGQIETHVLLIRYLPTGHDEHAVAVAEHSLHKESHFRQEPLNE